MKKIKTLTIKKVTLRDLDEPSLDAVAGGITATCLITICIGNTCPNHASCPITCGEHTCIKC